MRSFTASLNKLRARLHAKRIGPIVKQSPSVFIAACKALNISSVEVAYLGRYLVSIDVNSRSIAHGTLRDGAFQLELFQRVSAAFAERNTTFINVGANVGTTCLNAHHGGFRKFVAFEPVSNNFRLLTRNLAQIETDSTVTLRKQAVGSKAGRTAINLNPQSTGRHSIVRNFDGGSEEIEVVRLDDVLPRERGFLWIDTEGYELEVVRGAANYIATQADGLCVEINPESLGSAGLDELSSVLERSFKRCYTADGQTYARIKDVAALARGKQTDVICLK
jgi:FkbM family methyltransferase